MGFQVFENGEVVDAFQGKLIELKGNRMVLETDMFGDRTLVEFIRAEDSEL
jgi:hypothetical protein